MSSDPQDSVRQLLAGLHAERVATWKPEDLQVNIDQRRTLVETADPSAWIKPGDVVAPFELEDVEGGTLGLDDLLRDGPAVLVFFRFAGCPACNIALPYYQRRLWPDLQRLGASLTAVSPQLPDRLVEIRRRHDLGFRVASDPGNRLGRRFGITFESDEASRRASLSKGRSLGEVTGTGTWELPMPTVVVIGQDRAVRFADVAPDWLARTEAEPVLEAVRAISLQPAE